MYKRQEYTNAPVKGQLKIYKQGEVLKGFDKDFQYEMAGPAGAEFEVYAAEDIYTADHQVDADGQRTLYLSLIHIFSCNSMKTGRIDNH